MLIDIRELVQKYNLNIKNIFHLGANEGQEREVYNTMNLDAVYWVEAIPDVYERLLLNLYPYPNQHCVCACISDKDSEIKKFHISSNEGQSSSYLNLGTHKTAHPDVEFIDEIQVTTYRVDTILNAWNIDINETWLLIADLQGAEMDALIGCGKELDKFGAVYLEVNEQNLYEGCALKSDIENYLNEHNFEPLDEFIYKHWGWGDKFFVNRKLLQ